MAINDKDFYASHGISFDIEEMQIEYTKRVIKQAKIEVLTEIQLEIEVLPPHREYLNGYDNAGYKCTYGYKEYPPLAEDVNEIIQEKINKLKGERR